MMFTKCGITLSTPQVRQVIAYCDADRNGQVSLKELKWLVSAIIQQCLKLPLISP